MVTAVVVLAVVTVLLGVAGALLIHRHRVHLRRAAGRRPARVLVSSPVRT